MSQLQRAGQSGALDVATSQAVAKDQFAVLIDMLRQVAGNPRVAAGALEVADALNGPFTLYVDPIRGSDRFVGGNYNSHEAGATDEEIIAQKLRRISLQQLECGYTAARPFKTINRAAIEAAIITSRSWYTYTDPRAHVDCVTIVLSGGVHIVLNDPGSGSTSLASWGASKDPTEAELIAFNPSTGGVLLPRGCSMHGGDLRKSTVRPNWVPAVADEAADYSNRRSIFKVTGTGFFFNATTMDKIGHAESVHLLDTFHPASKAELDAFYAKVQSALGTGADLASALLVTRPSEYQIVGPIDQAQAPNSEWDTTEGSSTYIFNWSVRSRWGMGGAFWDGAKLSGLKSMVCANFTGTNQQKDMRCWQVYESGNWVSLTNTPEDYQKYIDADPDNVRRNPARHTRHISAINNAYIQKVSIFGIGQSEITMVDSGGEITDNGGNSTFGGCAAVAKGYKSFAFGKDKNWTVGRLRMPLNLSEKLSNIRRIQLGVVDSVTSSTITLTNGLAIGSGATVPAILEAYGYSLASGTRIWIENPNGADWRATLSANAWSSSAPAAIGITAAPLEAGTNTAAGDDAVGRRVYIRRVVDTRTVAERRCSLILNNTANARRPERNTVLQTDPNRSGGAIDRVLAAGGEEVLMVTVSGTGPLPGSGVAKTAEVTLRRGAPSKTYATATFYRQGTVVKHAGKHWQAISDLVSSGANPDPTLWGETFVHMPSDFNPEDSISQEAPLLVLDTDTSDADDSTTLGINWTTIWTSAGAVRDQYRTGTDYLGAYGFLRALGFTDAAAHAALVPRTAATRDRDPSSSADFPTAPSGGAATGLGNWAVEFRRPSSITMYNHQWEYTGYGNYSKAMPAVQQDMSEFNQFAYYFTSATGGRVTAKGTNEDGYEVTNRGLEDIATGATISPESLGGQSIDEVQRTDFPNGLTASEITVNRLVVNNSVELPDVSAASTTTTGPVRLADAVALRSQGSLAGNNDEQLNNSINAEPNVVTLKSLNYWKLQNRLVSARVGVQYVYVDPINGRDVTNINTLLAEPPITETGFDGSTQRQAVAVRSLAAAANYANQAYGPSTTVEFRCGPGVYLDRSAINFTTNVIIRAWSFSANTYLNDNRGGGTVPFATANFYDSTKQPVFLTFPQAVYSGDFFISQSSPLTLNFAERGEVIGCAWWGIMTTIASSAVPDSFFGSGGGYTAADSNNVSNWRALAKADPDNALNYFIREHAMKALSLGKFFGHRNRSCCEFQRSGRIANVAIGALSPSDAYMVGGTPTAVIKGSPESVTVSGLRMVGNCNISSAVNTDSFAAIRYRPGDYTTSTYQYTGWGVYLLGSISPEGLGVTFGIEGAQDGWNDQDGTAIYNQTWNNIQLLNNSLQIASSTADPSGSNWKTVGPAVQAIIGETGATVSAGIRNWTQFRIASNSSGGFDGKFGLYKDVNDALLRPYGAERIRALSQFGTLEFDTGFTVFRVAGSGNTPTVSFSGLDPGDVGAYVNFNDLNVRVRAHKQGVDVNNAYIHYGDFTL